jgi:hypothetical protein
MKPENQTPTDVMFTINIEMLRDGELHIRSSWVTELEAASITLTCGMLIRALSAVQSKQIPIEIENAGISNTAKGYKMEGVV